MDLEYHMVAILREQSKKPLLMFAFRMGSMLDLGEEQHLRFLFLLTFIQRLESLDHLSGSTSDWIRELILPWTWKALGLMLQDVRDATDSQGTKALQKMCFGLSSLGPAGDLSISSSIIIKRPQDWTIVRFRKAGNALNALGHKTVVSVFDLLSIALCQIWRLSSRFAVHHSVGYSTKVQ